MERATLEQKLYDAIVDANRDIQQFRDRRTNIVKLYAGGNYADSIKQKRPYNMISLATRSMVHRLVGGEPAVYVSTDAAALRGEAESLRIDLNLLLKEIKLAKTIRKVVTDSLLSPFSVIKVGICGQNAFGTDKEIYQEFAEIVSMDDFVFDNSPKNWDQVQFMGNRYTLPIEQVKYLGKTGFFDKEVAAQITPYMYSRDDTGPRTSEITQDNTRRPQNTLFEMAELWDIYLPFQRKVITLCSSFPGKFLRYEDYNGPDEGPYHVLSYNEVPNQLIGKAPASDWIELDAVVNQILSKLNDQAVRQKTIVLGEKTTIDEDEAAKVLNASDGSFTTVSGVGQLREISFGGASPMNQSAFVLFRGLASMVMGNLDQLTGQRGAGETLGQEQLLQANSDVSTAYMITTVNDWLKSVVNAIAWHRFYNPMASRRISKDIKGTDLKSESWFSPSDSQGDFLEYNFDIQPYSMVPRTPAKDAADIERLLNMMIPMYPMLQQQGLDINIQGILERLSIAMNLPGLDQIVKGAPERAARGDGSEEKNSDGMSHERTKAPNTTRTVIRKSAGTSQQGTEMGMMNAMLGAGKE